MVYQHLSCLLKPSTGTSEEETTQLPDETTIESEKETTQLPDGKFYILH